MSAGAIRAAERLLCEMLCELFPDMPSVQERILAAKDRHYPDIPQPDLPEGLECFAVRQAGCWKSFNGNAIVAGEMAAQNPGSEVFRMVPAERVLPPAPEPIQVRLGDDTFTMRPDGQWQDQYGNFHERGSRQDRALHRIHELESGPKP